MNKVKITVLKTTLDQELSLIHIWCCMECCLNISLPGGRYSSAELPP